MTYNDLDMTKHPQHINCHSIRVEHNGVISNHLIHGSTLKIAIHNLMSTGWFLNSSRSIIIDNVK